MDQRTLKIFFALLRSAICDYKLTEEEREVCTAEVLRELVKISSAHDLAHLLIFGAKRNGLVSKEATSYENYIYKAVCRYERIKYENEAIRGALEAEKVPFIFLKGAVIRKYYPEAWMRTSCDIDLLVHEEDLDRAVRCLSESLNYTEKARASHDVSLFSPSGVKVELHFDLVEEGRANNAIAILKNVWENAVPCDGGCSYAMTDEFFYFYHIAHMAKHFENGGCGIRPFIDLWLLDRIEGVKEKRDSLLSKGQLLTFADASRALVASWFGDGSQDELLIKMQSYVLRGGTYGSVDNRVSANRNGGNRIKYLFSRVFVPYSKLARYYPVLKKHKWLMPVMQVRRWFMLLRPSVAKMAKKELEMGGKVSAEQIAETRELIKNIGL